jgi:hypothetical protein
LNLKSIKSNQSQLSSKRELTGRKAVDKTEIKRKVTLIQPKNVKEERKEFHPMTCLNSSSKKLMMDPEKQ